MKNLKNNGFSYIAFNIKSPILNDILKSRGIIVTSINLIRLEKLERGSIDFLKA